MPKATKKKAPPLPLKNAELIQMAATKSTMKKIARGHQEIQRLIRRVEALRATTDRLLDQFVNAHIDRRPAQRPLLADDTVEAVHG